MRAAYQLRVWQEDDWWLARVVAASEGANNAPLNAITQARSLSRIDSMGRDLIATILDADETDFDVEFEYALPDDLGELIHDAKGARGWLDAAQALWQERSAVAARALTDRGYSLREAATLMGLSHQRIDQLLADHMIPDGRRVMIFVASSNSGHGDRKPSEAGGLHDVDALLVLRCKDADQSRSESTWPREGLEARFRERIGVLIRQVALEAAS
jgi:hypothetical protein